ncbi:MAG: hypothetical protein AB7S86_00440 [Hydrogenophaga sp.]|uniref:hypothetical protein n=1 Tax=Hydrogenophaga sp. TaxID=1904254 RepID=UPI003D0A2424
MDKNTLFVKTDQGREALTSRPPGLGPRLRSLLIMVDGKRPVAELDKLSGGEGSAAPLLEQLAAAGWVEPVQTAAADPVVAAQAAPVAEPAALPPLPFSEARRMLVRFINDQLGPMGEPLALRVESCKTPVDLLTVLPRIRDGLSNLKGAATLQRFDQELVSRLPRF